MRLSISGYLGLREVLGKQATWEIDAAEFTVRDLIRHLASELGSELAQTLRDPETGDLSRHVAILINGRHYSHLPDGLDTRLAHGDEVAIFPPLVGG